MKLPTGKLGIPVLAISIFVGTMIILSIFFFITIYKNENMLEKRGFRVLTQLGSSIAEKDQLIARILKYTNYNAQKEINPFLSGLKIEENETGSSGSSLLYKMSKEDSTGDLATKTKNKDRWSWNDHIKKNEKNQVFDSIRFSVKKFITPLLRKEFFTNYILLCNDTQITYSSFPGDINLSKEDFIRQKSRCLATIPGSISGKTGLDSTGAPFIQGGFIENINIQGTEYLLFVIPVKFHDNNSYYLGGFVEEKTFLSWKRSLSSNLIVVFIIIFLIIIFGLPILKVFITGPLEKLTRLGITLVGISLVGGTILAVVLFSELLLDYKITKDNFQNLERLNRQLTKNFNCERDSILCELKRFNEKWNEKPGVLTSILVSDKMSDYFGTSLIPNYKNFKSIIWADSNGRQYFSMTTYKKKVYTPNVKSRDFFINPEKYKTTIDGDPKPVWYGMEAFYSNTTGDWSIGFSIPGKEKSHAKIVALTSPLNSIKDPVLPNGYEYCLIDKTGKVWYHSEDFYKLNDNLVDEFNDQRFVNDLVSNSADFVKIETRNKKYLTYLSPIENTDLFMVTMFNTSRVNTMTSFSASFTICFLGLFLLIIFLLVIIMGLIGSKKRKSNNYLFSWFTPKKSRSRKYEKLLILNISVFFLMIILEMFHVNNRLELHNFLFYLFLLLGFVCFITHFVMRSADTEKTDKKQENKYLQKYNRFILSWLIIISIIPAILVMKRIYLEETKWYLNDQQHYIAKKIIDRTNTFYKLYKENLPEQNQETLFKVRNSQGIYYPNLFKDTLINSSRDNETSFIHAPTLFPNIDELRNYYYDVMRETGSFTIDPLLSDKIVLFSDSVRLSFDRISYDKNFTKTIENATLISHRTGLETFTLHQRNFPLLIFYIFIILLFIYLLHLEIGAIVKRLFGIEHLKYSRTDIIKYFKTLETIDINSVVISMDESVEDEIANSGWKCIDLSEEVKKKSIPAGTKTVYINFPTGLSPITLLEERITRLETGLENKQVAFIIKKPPSLFISEMQENWKQSPKPLKASDLINRLERMLLRLPVIYWFKPVEATNDPVYCSHVNSIIEGEMKFNPSFIKYKSLLNFDFADGNEDSHKKCDLNKEFQESCKDSKKLILRIIELSDSFYRKFWNTLTLEEQFVLVDIAEDSLINLQNKEIIQALQRKGILVIDDEIEFVSKGFKYFIQTSADKTEIREYELVMGKAGNWHRMKVPLILVATSIFVFLFATQQTILSNMNTILVSGFTVLSVFLRFSGIFSKSKEGS